MWRLLLLSQIMVCFCVLWLTHSRCRTARLLRLSLRKYPAGFGDAVWLRKVTTPRRRLTRNYALVWTLLGIYLLLCWGWTLGVFPVGFVLKSNRVRYGRLKDHQKMSSNQ